MKWIRRIGIVFATLLVLGGLFAWWLLASEAGARFALARAKAALAGKLEFAQAHGSLVGPLQLHDVRYRDPAAGLDVSIQNVKLDYAFSRLFARTLHVFALELDGIVVARATVAPTTPAAPAPSLESLLTPPLAILLDRAHASRIAVTQDGKQVFAGDSLDLSASWTNHALTLRQFALRAPDGKLDLEGALTSYRDLRGNAKLAFDWRLTDRRVTGTADVQNEGKLTTLAARLNQPLVAALAGNISATDDALPWTLQLDVPEFNAAKIARNESIRTLALKLQGSGDRAHGKINGSLHLNAHRVLFDPLQFSLAGQTLVLESLRLRSPEAAGELSAQAQVRLDAAPIAGDATLDWNGVELPTDLVGQTLVSHGHLRAGGTADAYEALGDFSIGPPKKLAEIALELHGTPQAIALQRLALKQAKGGLDTHGTVTLRPQIGWDLVAKADQLDPGAFVENWPGAVNFTLSTNGQMQNNGPAGRVQLHGLGGTLRQRALAGDADLRFAAPLRVDGTLTLKSGNSSVALRGRSGDRTDVSVDVAIASLGDWLPQTGGSVRGNIAAQGVWPRLDARGKLDVSKIVFGDTHVDTAAIAFDAHDLSTPSGHVRIDAKTLSTSGYLFDTVTVDARGEQSAHSLSAELRGPQLGLTLALDGSLAANHVDWQGTLSTLSLAPKGAPTWILQSAAVLKYTNSGFALSDLCLHAESSSVCASASQDAAGAAQAKFTIAHLPLATIARFASPDSPLKLDGEINGDGDLERAVDGALDGRAKIASASGSIAYPDSATQPLVAYRDFTVEAVLAPQGSRVQLRGELNDGGRLDGRIALGANTAGATPLSGQVTATLNNLGFIDLLSDQTASSTGRLDAKFDLGGSTSAPTLAGRLGVADFATEIPAAGIKLHEGHIALQSADGRAFSVEGSIASGSGKLALSGNAGFAECAPIAVKIAGEDFLAADIPGAQVRVSPDVALTREAGTFRLSGTVGIPKADIDLDKLPGGGAAASSPDVVVTDAATSKSAAASTPLDADITVKIGAGEKLAMDLRQGQEVHLVGFGLNGYLGGQLAVQEKPGRTATGRGAIVVDGTYKAYGQDLKIEQGRLLFAGTPVDNPGLDLRATRSFTNPDVKAGLQVRGTAQVPVLTVFSDPPMEQSDALSYLVAGKPMSQLKSGEGDAVGSAARALGTAGGDLLAKSIGSKMGVDDVGVADSTAVGGAALTVGKYLSPRLYLSYGVGLFTPGEVVTLRYRLTRLFNVEIQNGTLSSRAGLNYRIEK